MIAIRKHDARRNATWVLAVLALVALVCLSAPTPAAAQTTYFSLPFAASVLNPCNSDVVMIDGMTDMTITTTTDSAGGLHNTMHSVTKGDGVVVATGVRYLLSQEQNLILEMSGSSQAKVTTDVLNMNLNGTGPTPNFLFKITAHLTINGKGVPSAPVLNVTTKCTG